MRRGPRTSVLAFALSVLALGACTAPDGTDPVVVVDDPTPVTVTRKTITSVVTVDASVVAAPTVDLVSQTPGRELSFPKLPAGPIAADTVIATYTSPGDVVVRLSVPVETQDLRRRLQSGATFPAGLPIARLQLNSFAVQAQVEGDALYRFADSHGDARAQVPNGPGPFDCPLVGGVTATEDELSLTCVPEDRDVRLINGVAAVMAVNTGQREDVLTLPLSAVAGLAGRGTVNLVSAGSARPVDVELGLSDGVSVEIVSGVDEGDQVTATPPRLSDTVRGHR